MALLYATANAGPNLSLALELHLQAAERVLDDEARLRVLEVEETLDPSHRNVMPR